MYVFHQSSAKSTDSTDFYFGAINGKSGTFTIHLTYADSLPSGSISIKYVPLLGYAKINRPQSAPLRGSKGTTPSTPSPNTKISVKIYYFVLVIF